MRRAVLWLLRAEVTLACHLSAAGEYWAARHLSAVGEYWAARAARRLGKFSGDFSGGLK